MVIHIQVILCVLLNVFLDRLIESGESDHHVIDPFWEKYPTYAMQDNSALMLAILTLWSHTTQCYGADKCTKQRWHERPNMEEVISAGHDRWISHSEDGHRIQAHVSHHRCRDAPQSGLFGASEPRSDKHSADGDFTGFAENQLEVFLCECVCTAMFSRHSLSCRAKRWMGALFHAVCTFTQSLLALWH